MSRTGERWIRFFLVIASIASLPPSNIEHPYQASSGYREHRLATAPFVEPERRLQLSWEFLGDFSSLGILFILPHQCVLLSGQWAAIVISGE